MTILINKQQAENLGDKVNVQLQNLRMNHNYVNNNIDQRMTPSAWVDESYIVVGVHLDEATIKKIVEGSYVDFSKLIPRDRVLAEEDTMMEMVVKNGHAFWVLVNVGIQINNFNKWEQAFRVYSNIYCKANPHRSAELIEYNHVIHTISMAYIWENVYMYDKEFRLHMARNPGRSWSIILQQAWSMRLKD